MSPPLTFKQYLESKKQLREAAKDTPHRKLTYKVQRYCKIVIGETTKQHISLNPGNNLVINWLYEDIDNPTPISIHIHGIKTLDKSEALTTCWDGEKLSGWLNRNTSRNPLFPWNE